MHVFLAIAISLSLSVSLSCMYNMIMCIYIYIYIYIYICRCHSGDLSAAQVPARGPGDSTRSVLGSSGMWCLRMWCLIIIVL